MTRRLRPAVGIALVALFGVIAGLALLPAAALAQGCSMCKTALDGPPDPLTQAFNVSSLLLMAVPYTLVGAFGAWIVVATRRRNREAAHADAVHEID